MTNKFNPQQKNTEEAIYGNQLITIKDLNTFKSELLVEIKEILHDPEHSTHQKWLRSRDVRKLLGISPGTLQNMRINGSLPYTKVGGVIFYQWNDIDAMIESNRINNAL